MSQQWIHGLRKLLDACAVFFFFSTRRRTGEVCTVDCGTWNLDITLRTPCIWHFLFTVWVCSSWRNAWFNTPPGGEGSDACAHGGDMSSRASQWPFPQPATKATTRWRLVQSTTAVRAQTTDRERREVEERDLHDAPRRQKPPPPGTRPAPWLRCGRRRVRAALRQRLRACSRYHSAEAWERTGGSAERCFSGEQNVDIPVHGGGRFQIPLGGLQGSRPGQGSIVHAMPALAVEYISPAQAVSRSPAPVIEYFSLAPAVFQAPAPMVEFVAPAPAVVCSPAPACSRQLWNLLHPR